MIAAGAFALCDTSDELHVITGYLARRGDVVRLCRLSTGLIFTLPPGRIAVPEDGIGAFRTHVIQFVTTTAIGEKEPMKRSQSIGFSEYLDRYVEIVFESSALYRLDGIVSYLCQYEWRRFNHPTYSQAQAVTDIIYQCDALGIQPPSDSVIKARLKLVARAGLQLAIGASGGGA
ncbi:hypothetical protein [Pseudomonas putida]|uniref:hypothetical protein n=1 Tax=Pseudomonas putida TaxID=303 RepID=UPI0039DFE746